MAFIGINLHILASVDPEWTINESECLKSARILLKGQTVMDPLKKEHEGLLKFRCQCAISRTKRNIDNK